MDDYKNTINKLNAELDYEEKQFENNVWNAIYLKHKSDFDSIFIGFKSSKRKFAENIKTNYKNFTSYKSSNKLEELSIEYNNLVLNKPEKYYINYTNLYPYLLFVTKY